MCPAHREPFCPRRVTWYGSGWVEARPGSGGFRELWASAGRGSVLVRRGGRHGGLLGQEVAQHGTLASVVVKGPMAVVGAPALMGFELRVVMRRVS